MRVAISGAPVRILLEWYALSLRFSRALDTGPLCCGIASKHRHPHTHILSLSLSLSLCLCVLVDVGCKYLCLRVSFLFRQLHQKCVLCPDQSGAFKETDDGRWCHVQCALWMPHVRIEDMDKMERITDLHTVVPERYELVSASLPALACGVVWPNLGHQLALCVHQWCVSQSSTDVVPWMGGWVFACASCLSDAGSVHKPTVERVSNASTDTVHVPSTWDAPVNLPSLSCISMTTAVLWCTASHTPGSVNVQCVLALFRRFLRMQLEHLLLLACPPRCPPFLLKSQDFLSPCSPLPDVEKYVRVHERGFHQ